jgi:hypothetical protein
LSSNCCMVISVLKYERGMRQINNAFGMFTRKFFLEKR